MIPKIPDVTIKALRAVLDSPTIVDWVTRIADGASVSAGDLDRLLKVAQAQAMIAGNEFLEQAEQAERDAARVAEAER